MDIPFDRFRAHMEQLRPLASTLRDALEHLVTGSQGTRVVVTFDDAFANFFDLAWPVLCGLGVPAVLYVPTDFVDGRGAPPLRGAERLRPCSWDALREATATGLLEVGSHTCSHRDLARLDPRSARDELTRSRARLEDELGRPVTSFCYPRGRSAPWLEPLVRERYATAVVRGGRKLTAARWSPWQLERVPVRRDGPPDALELLSAGVWLEEWLSTRFQPIRSRRG
ncbi:MAG: polysaccharide deacetylase family protein [Planctomycetes bacterium]|nr:polysaccharide deacetylase family protein [Planctomycetota bacterium]